MLNILIFILLYIFILIINNFINKNNSEKVKLNFLSLFHTNILKGIAASMVVMQHVGNIYGSRAFTPLGGIGVSIFIICSGYGLLKSYNKKGLDNFIKKRLLKILIPYWIIVIFYNSIHYGQFRLIKFIKEILLFNAIPYMWFVQLILILYIAFYVIYKFVTERKRILLFFFISLSSLLLIQYDLWAEQSFAFITGIILANYYPKFNFNNKRKILYFSSICLIIGLISLCLKQLPQIRNANYIIINIDQAILKTITAIGIVYITSLLLNIKLITIFMLPGRFSYEIYLIHTLFLYIIKSNKGIITIILYLIVCNLFIFILKVIIDNIFKIKLFSLQ